MKLSTLFNPCCVCPKNEPIYCILFWNQRVYIANNARVQIIWIFTMLNFTSHMGGKDIYKYLETEDILDFGKLFTKFQSFRSEMSSPQ